MDNKKEEMQNIFDKLNDKNKDTLSLIAQAIKAGQDYKKEG